MTSDQSEQLVAYLKSRRWFGDKTRTIRGVRLRDRIVVNWPNADRDFAVARADVDTAEGTSTYQLFLDSHGDAGVDALEDEQFRRGLVDAFGQGASFDNGNTRWIITSEGRQPLVAPPAAKITLSTAEQSNSSVMVEGAAILKLFRRLEPGVHPDVEVTRFLTIDRQFLHVPVLLGTIRFEDASGTTIAGMLQELVPGAQDGWSYALDCTRDYFAQRTDSKNLPFQDEARQLGGITRAMHETLASGDSGSAFERTTATSGDVTDWVRATTVMAERSLASLRTAIDSNAVSRGSGDDPVAVATRGERFSREIAGWTSVLSSDAGAKARTHGDYHLGQVLRSAAAQFLVIDFEGEPARPLSERRKLQSPLRDVAGMLRSFAYLGAVASGEGNTRDDRATRWERSTRAAFLRGYFEHSGPSRLLPQDQANTDRLLTLFETEKVFYELQYELDHRPDWAWIPLRGILALAS